jgi:hypothetical protein
MSTCNMTCYDMRIWVGPKNTDQFTGCNDSSIWVSKQIWSKISQFRFILKTFLFSVWVSNSEERKANPRKLYLRVLVRITESLYSGGSAPVSRSASAYVRYGLAFNSASGSESTISPIIILN